MKKINVVIADDHPMFLKGLKDSLFEDSELELIGTAPNGNVALEMIRTLLPDVAILDMDMPLMNGIEVSRELIKDEQNIKIIILTMHKDPDMIKASMALGINGYVFKDDAVNDIVNAIKSVYYGENFITKQLLPTAQIHFDSTTKEHIGNLTKKEILVLKAIANQKSSKEIADEHFISVKTVENHRNNISRKLNITGSNSLLKFALSVKSLLK